jgi:predicted kinase
VPQLIHLNGPPGIGKSTIAQRYVADHAGVLNLDIDRIRGLIGGWHEDFAGAGEIVRPIAISMATTHLSLGRDVVMPQYLGAIAELERFENAVLATGSRFREIVLMDSQEQSVERFYARGGTDHDPWHAHVVRIVEAAGGAASLAEMHGRLCRLVALRPHAVTITSAAGAIEATYEALLDALDS